MSNPLNIHEGCVVKTRSGHFFGPVERYSVDSASGSYWVVYTTPGDKSSGYGKVSVGDADRSCAWHEAGTYRDDREDDMDIVAVIPAGGGETVEDLGRRLKEAQKREAAARKERIALMGKARGFLSPIHHVRLSQMSTDDLKKFVEVTVPLMDNY